MTIELITGAPGTGKTYYSITRILDEFVGLTLITNIDGIKLPHIGLQGMLDRAGGVDAFFDYAYQEKLPFRDVLYVLDEAQIFFPKKYYNERVFNYFQRHRHLGHHILLITQNSQIIPYQLVALCDFETYFMPQKISMIGELSYKTITPAGGPPRDCPITRIRKRKDVFKYYKSTSSLSKVKISGIYTKRFVWLFIFLAVGVFFFWKNFYSKPAQSAPPSPPSSSPPVPTSSTFVPPPQSVEVNSTPQLLIPLPSSYDKQNDTVSFVYKSIFFVYPVPDFLKMFPVESFHYSFSHSPHLFFRIYSRVGDYQFFPVSSSVYSRPEADSPPSPVPMLSRFDSQPASPPTFPLFDESSEFRQRLRHLEEVANSTR